MKEEKAAVIDMTKYVDSEPVVEKCSGCERVFDFPLPGPDPTAIEFRCLAYYKPAAKWKNGNCALASHVSAAAETKKAKINPIKASKRARR